ncbi:MAG: alpha/beta hydrolase [Rhodobacteraceae bacterium]|nr:alpha/beta hydrolase [Paracoccaceae bacterium]
MGERLGKDIVLIHGAFAGPWSMDTYAGFFRERGWTVHTPAFRGHGGDPSEEPAELNGASVLDYVEDIAAAVAATDTKPVLLGHAIGGVVAQKLAARGLASAVVLINPNAPYGTLPATDDERAVARGLMEGGAFWTAPMRVPFEMFREFAFNKLSDDEARATYDRLGSESGKVMFEMFFWMFDDAAATKVEIDTVDCPVLVVSGSEDRAVNPATCRDLAARYGTRGTFLAAKDHAHFLFLEPGWETVAGEIEGWLKGTAEGK